MDIQYSIISKFYDIIDVLYFNRKNYSPRKAVIDYIKQSKIKVLDICTGTASNGILVAEKKTNANVIGIDLSKEMLRLANKKIQKKHIKNFQTYVMDATKMDFDDKTFDAVIISLVLHEINEELAVKILNEAKRVLRQDGEIIIVEWEQPNNLFQRFMFLFIKLLEPKGFRAFLKLNLNDYFSKQGFTVNQVKHCDYSQVFQLKL